MLDGGFGRVELRSGEFYFVGRWLGAPTGRENAPLGSSTGPRQVEPSAWEFCSGGPRWGSSSWGSLAGVPFAGGFSSGVPKEERSLADHLGKNQHVYDVKGRCRMREPTKMQCSPASETALRPNSQTDPETKLPLERNQLSQSTFRQLEHLIASLEGHAGALRAPDGRAEA